MSRSRIPFPRAVLLLGALALAACDDPNGLTDTAHAQLTVTTPDAPVVSTQSDGSPVIACHIYVHVVSGGPASLKWTGGMLRWYAGPSRAAAVDSTGLSEADAADLAGGAELGAGAESGAHFMISASIPFEAELELRYKPAKGGHEQSTRSRFTCGPVPGASAPPRVTVVSAVPLVEPLQPGGTLRITYDVTSEIGLWQTLVGVAGPCSAAVVSNESLADRAHRTVDVKIPARCPVGSVLTIVAAGVDAAMRETSVSQSAGSALADLTAPTLTFRYEIQATGWGEYDRIRGGDYFPGDTIVLAAVRATDNNVVQDVVWEVQPANVRGSVPLARDSSVYRDRIRIPVDPAWGASFQLRVFARDVTGNESAKYESAPDAFHVFPNATRAVTTVPLPNGGGEGLLYDDRSDRLFLWQRDVGRILVYSGTTLALQRTINLSVRLNDVDVAPGGDTLFVTTGLYPVSLVLVDLTGVAPRQQVVPLGTTAATQGGQVRVLSNTVFVTVSDGGLSPGRNARILAVDRATLAVTEYSDRAADRLYVRSLDHSKLMLTGTSIASGTSEGCSQWYDAGTSQLGPCLTTNIFGGMPSSDERGDHVSVAQTIYTSGLAVAGQARYPNSPPGPGGDFAQLSADGTELFSRYGLGIVRSRVSDGALLEHVPLPHNPFRLAVSADGSTLFAASSTYDGLAPFGLSRIPLR